MGASGKEPICQCRRHKDMGLIPVSGRSPGEGDGNPLQYSCLENPTDKEPCGLWSTALQSQHDSGGHALRDISESR